MTTDIITVTEEELMKLDLPYEETDDPGAKAHLINPPMNTHIFVPGMTAQDIVFTARAFGLEVVALCGYKWVPKHNPEKLPSCERCFEIAGEIMRDAGE